MHLIGLTALVAVAACSSHATEDVPPPRSAVTLPPSAFQVSSTQALAGLRDSRTVTTFCLHTSDRAELSSLPCTPVPTSAGHASCTWRKLHTEVSVQTEERGSELIVTVIEAEYDNCLFEGCQKAP